MKTKNTKLHQLTHILSASLVVAVMLTATHAKDIVGQPMVRSKTSLDTATAARTQDDPAQKSMSDLHNHTDKTMLKNIAKSMGDASSLAARRDERDGSSEDERTFSQRLFEAYLMLQFAYASAIN